MKTRLLLLSAVCLLSSGTVFLSCKKEKKTGDIQVAVTAQINQPSGEVCAGNGVKVDLIKDGTVLASQTYTGGSGNSNVLDFGNYEYDDYEVKGTSDITCYSLSTGASHSGGQATGSTSFKLDAPTKSVSLTVKN
jgi:hypothetical protein